jgi:RNA polymerase sigma factor for flagellar operon FliA
MGSIQVAAYQEEIQATETNREQLILEHLPLVRWIAYRIRDRLPPEFSLDDLVSVGIIGLINAIDSFDPSQNVKLGTFASYRIRGAIMDSIRGMDGIAAHHRKLVKQIQSTITALEQRLQRQPSEEEIAREMGLPLDEYQALLLQTRAVTVGSLDAAPPNTEKMSFLSVIADRADYEPGHQFEREELKRVVAEGVRCLPPVERQILGLYYQEELNLKEIAEIMNLHYSRISQLKSQAILRLRALLAKKWPNMRGEI